MIKFFNKIRLDLIETNKTGRYIKYALGEILLVVIGILIALQINNGNEFRKERQQEQELLAQLHSEFMSNLDQIDEKIGIRNNMIDACLKLLGYIDHPEQGKRDSILQYLAFTQISPTFDPIVNDLTSSGRIQFIQNATLKEKLSRWTSEIIQVTEEEDAWRQLRSVGLAPYLIKNIEYRTLINRFWQTNTIGTFLLDRGQKTEFEVGDSKTQVDMMAVIEDPLVENYIATCASMAKLANTQSYLLRNRILEILKLLEADLKP